MRRRFWTTCCAALAATTLLTHPVQADAPRPNIVHIFADDFGYGSVGYNGQTQIATPHIDAIAAGGIRFLNAYSAPVCAPSRSMLYTGFHQGHGVIDGNDAISGGDGFRAEDVMTGQVLAAAGYSTGVFGKWGFGATSGSSPIIDAPQALPNNHGFDEFYGYLNHGAAHDYFQRAMWQTNPGAPNGVSILLNNGGPGGTAQYTHDLIAARSEQFIADHANDAEPFYLQVNYTIPHTDLDDIASAPGGYGQYASMPGWTNEQKAYAAMITRMDSSIGSLVAKLDSLGLADDTLVIFTSDNGGDKGTFAQPRPQLVDFFNANGDFRGGKFESFEGGIHVPAVAYWPGVIEAGSETAYRTDLADFMATVADLSGGEAPVGIDGVSIVPTLTGEGQQRQRDYLVFEHQGSRGTAGTIAQRMAVVRQDGMKLIFYGDESVELFNLNDDPDENNPLPLGIQANADTAAELRAAAVAEGALRGVVQYRVYNGADGANVQADFSWDGAGRPNGYWSAKIANTSGSPRIAHVTEDVTTLGVEVRGSTALQVVDVHDDTTLSGRNEVRIGALGRVDLSGGTLKTNRWIDLKSGGELRGDGDVVGDVYNDGVIAPGRPDDSPAWGIAAPPALPSLSLDTNVVTAVNFNFAGVQDDVPLQATTTLSQYLEVTKGLDIGPGVSPKLGNGGTDNGNEFNLMGHRGADLNAAKQNGDYISFTVDPIDGVGMIPASVSFSFWRDPASGANGAAKEFAIMSSLDRFASPLAQATYANTGSGAQNTLTAALPAIESITQPVEYRLYSWGAGSGGGNTHFNSASLNARFVAVPTFEFDFAGTHDGSPLTALKREDARATLTAGLHFGPGAAPSGSSMTDELRVAGFSTADSLQAAIEGENYLSFSIQSIAGMAVLPDSVSFTLWRDGGGSATDYAIMASSTGFDSGQQLSDVSTLAFGSSNEFQLTGIFADAEPTTEPVEFRLYGWRAASSLDPTHVIAASMRARFASVAGSVIDPTGVVAVQGDFFHLEGGTIALDLGGTTAGVDYDRIEVTGSVVLEGDLSVSLADAGGGAFQPSLGSVFEVLTATAGISGQFANVSLPTLGDGLDWEVIYGTTAVSLGIFASADFNRDGEVDGDDLAAWQSGAGQAASAEKSDGDADGDGVVDGTDFLTWQRQVGMGKVSVATSANVPEPGTFVLLFSVAFLFCATRRVRE